MEKVVITGMGVVSPIGNTVREFMQGMDSSKQGIGHICNFPSEHFPSRLGAEVKCNENDGKIAMDRKIFFLEKALAELLDNNDTLQNYSPSNRILNIGSGLDYFDLSDYIDSTDHRLNKWHQYSKNAYYAIEKLAQKYQIHGGLNVNVSACVASNHALGLSFRLLKQTRQKIIVSGGTDSMLNPLHYMGFYKLGALSDWEGKPQEACRPFDKNRCGLVLGEGATVFLLQNAKEAFSDKIIAEIAGYGSTMDAYLVTDPQPEGLLLAKAARQAIQEAGITTDDIDCVHLHGTGTPKNDPAEANAMKLIFGDRTTEIPVFSLKGQVGHLIAACGALEMLGVIYSLQMQQVPPTINFTDPDPEIPLKVVTGKPLKMPINYILKLNAAFGGQNTSFVVKKYA
jgi:3-oxoacyl-[acyl-carrier-protein] synthase II